MDLQETNMSNKTFYICLLNIIEILRISRYMLYKYSLVVFEISTHILLIIFLLHHFLSYKAKKNYLSVLFIQIYISFYVVLN